MSLRVSTCKAKSLPSRGLELHNVSRRKKGTRERKRRRRQEKKKKKKELEFRRSLRDAKIVYENCTASYYCTLILLLEQRREKREERGSSLCNSLSFLQQLLAASQNQQLSLLHAWSSGSNTVVCVVHAVTLFFHCV